MSKESMQWNQGLDAGFSEAEPEKIYLTIIQNSLYHINQ